MTVNLLVTVECQHGSDPAEIAARLERCDIPRHEGDGSEEKPYVAEVLVKDFLDLPDTEEPFTD